MITIRRYKRVSTIRHRHPLVFNENEKALYGRRVLCVECKKRIISCPWISCPICNFSLHKACVDQFPCDIKHPMHSHHTSYLTLYSPIDIIHPCTLCCDKYKVGLAYCCEECLFNVHIFCASEKVDIKHPSHDHPLILLQRKMTIRCNACLQEETDRCYICLTCQYVLHYKCANLPITINHAAHHHPLTLLYSILEFTTQNKRVFISNCGICDRVMALGARWRYFCSKCKFAAHLKCAIEVPSRDASWPSKETKSEANCLRFPLTTHLDFIIREATNDQKLDYLFPCSYHKGRTDLKLQKANDFNKLLICDACVTPIFPDSTFNTFYCCDPVHPSCDFFLHEVCSKLRFQIDQHPCHTEHTLTLSRNESIYKLVHCNGCKRPTNGLVYKCDSCNFVLDVKCALLPSTILHNAHKHPLVLRGNISRFICQACGVIHNAGFKYGCNSCGYSICSKSALWSQFTRHPWDEHPLSLIHRPSVELPEKFYCEICEVEMNSPDWFYHCSDCDNFFHPNCLPQYDVHWNIKFGGTLHHEKHPHPLKFRRRSKIRYTTKCECCGLKLVDVPLFECTQACDLAICHRCIYLELWK